MFRLSTYKMRKRLVKAIEIVEYFFASEDTKRSIDFTKRYLERERNKPYATKAPKVDAPLSDEEISSIDVSDDSIWNDVWNVLKEHDPELCEAIEKNHSKT